MKAILEMRKLILACMVLFSSYLFHSCSDGQSEQRLDKLVPYPEELQARIGRGLVALPKDQNRVFLSWRLLPSDPPNISFNIYRSEGGKTDKPAEAIAQTDTTFYIDDGVQENKAYVYSVIPISNGKQGEPSPEVPIPALQHDRNALVFDLEQNYKYAQVVTGDINGDGELEIVVKHANSKKVDPYKKAWRKSEDTIKLTAFQHTGKRLWTFDLGWGIEAGSNYSPIVIWDINADGRAEVIVKTNKSGDRLDYESERLTVIDGETGQIIKEAKWPRIEGHFADNYNNNSRNYIAVAHLDGKNPSVIAVRGLYKTQVIWAYDRELNKVWERTIGKDIYNPITNKWLKKMKLRKLWGLLFKDTGRGSHSLPIADINGDGKEEILWGEHCIGEKGKDLWVVEDQMPYNGHADIVWPADIMPAIEGKEVFYCREGWYGRDHQRIGMMLTDNKGNTIWAHWGLSHVDGGWVGRLMMDSNGLQCFGFDIKKKKWSSEGAKYTQKSTFLWDAAGKQIATPPESWIGSALVDWDGDGMREVLIRQNGDVQKYDGTVVAKLGHGCSWGADLFGDHREEIVAAPGNVSLLLDQKDKQRNDINPSGKIYIYFNTDTFEGPPKITKIADRQYRNDLSRTALQGNNAPSEGGYIPLEPMHNKDI